MNRITSTLTRTLIGLLLCCFAAQGFAQDAKLQLDNLDKLSAKAARVTDVTLDGSLLQFAVGLIQKIDAQDEDVAQLQNIIKNLKGIYIKSFEFDEASQYTKADIDAIRSQLTGPRWTKIVQSVEKRHNEYDEIYLLKNGDRIGGVVILVAEAKELTVVNLVGDVPVDKISSLERHLAPSSKESGKNESGKNKEKQENSHEEE
jgi:vacuolar-type H+-ATPase subunit I/STV1